ncbi:MAG: hypothetical protein WC956_01715 [bacterium]
MHGVAPIFSFTIENVPTARPTQSILDGIEPQDRELEADAKSETADVAVDAAAEPVSIPSFRFNLARLNFLDRDATLLALARLVPGAVGRMIKPDLNKSWPIAFFGAGILLARMDQQERSRFLSMASDILRSGRVAGRPTTPRERLAAIRLSLQSLAR